MYDKSIKTPAGEKITITTRYSPEGVEQVVLCIGGKSGNYIVDVAVNLSEENLTTIVSSLQEAFASLRNKNSAED